MPGTNGYEIGQPIRADEALRRIALVALAGYGQGKDQQRAIAVGFDYLPRPRVHNGESLVQAMGTFSADRSALWGRERQEFALRFVLGGAIVSVFALLGEVVMPKRHSRISLARRRRCLSPSACVQRSNSTRMPQSVQYTDRSRRMAAC